MVKISRSAAHGSTAAANAVAQPDVMMSPAESIGCSAATRHLAEADLGRSGLTLGQAEAAGMFAVDDASTVNPDFAAAAGIIIPYHDEAGQPINYPRDDHTVLFCRVRYLVGPGWALPRGRKYDQPADSGSPLYIPRGFNRSAANHDGFVIVEGEKKAIALCAAGIPAVGIGGVWNFGGSGGSALHPTLASLAGHCPKTYIVFDSDAATKPEIQQAEWRLTGQIALAGGKPHVVRLPPDGAPKTGADDYLVKHGADSLIRLIQAAQPLGETATASNDVITVADLLRRQVKPVEELIPGIVEKGIPTFIAGPGGVHKSRLALQWGLCLNTGAAVWGLGAHMLESMQPQATLVFCSAEDDPDELARRATAISTTLKLPKPDQGVFLDCTGKDSALVVMGESGKVEVRPFYHELLARLRSTPGHKVVVLDSAYDFVRFAGRAKIDEDSVNYFIKVVLQRICEDGDCTLLIPWHPSQAGSERASMDGWSVAWHNAPRARLAIKAEKNVPDSYELSVAKRNHRPAGESSKLRFHNGALLPVDALPDDGKSAALRSACVKAALTAAEQRSPFTRQRKIPGWALKEAQAATGQTVNNTQFHDELESAVRGGALRYVPGTNKQMAGYYPADELRADTLARRRVRLEGGGDD